MTHRQRRYLQALGVDVWERRDPTTPEADEDAAPSSPPGPGELPEPQRTAPTTADDAEEVAAAPADRADAIAVMDWEALAATVAGCTACALHVSRTRTVFGVGGRNARWMVVGEAPGAEEDRQGEPFVGRAGKLLDEMLAAIGLDRGSVYIANILKCRPPRNRDPLPEEARSCRPFLDRQIALVRPDIIVAVGRIAAQNLLSTDTPVGRLRGRVHRLGEPGIPVVVTYHPAYLLRSPREKRKAWDDLKLARRTLAGSGAPP